MTIHTRKLPTFALYAAYTDEFGLTVFGSCRDEALNNLVEELAARRGQVGTRVGAPPSHEVTAGKEGSGQLARERKSDAAN
jgi:hypothetical protein